MAEGGEEEGEDQPLAVARELTSVRLWGFANVTQFSDKFDIDLDEDGKIIDFLSDTHLEATPEEFVRQHYLRTLQAARA